MRICLMALLLLAVAPGPLVGQELNWKSLEYWHRYILPKSSELTWQKVPWRPTYWGAVIEAQKKRRPILLWTMNGHPLANT